VFFCKVIARKAKDVFEGRSAGILLPISSLPSDGPIGDFGQEAYDFLKFLEQAGQRWWQILPLNPLNPVGSPYASTSSFAIETAYLNIERAFQACGMPSTEEHLLGLSEPGLKSKAVDYEKLWEYKIRALESLLCHIFSARQRGFEDFTLYKQQKASWLDDFALFEALRGHYRTSDWSLWPKELRDREIKAIAEARRAFSEQIEHIKCLQYLLEKQWQSIRQKAKDHGVFILGDMPFYVSLRSADVWAHQDLFLLDAASRRANLVAGVPPDAFNPEGQKWGNALFNWPALKDQGFSWWLARVGRQLELFDALRLDHFIGFYRSWHVAQSAPDAKSGSWDYAPGRDLLKALQLAYPAMPFVAEDLGSVTTEVIQLRDEFKLPGMRVMQFGFGAGGVSERLHLPHYYVKNCLAYTGTHDNNTCKGWMQQLKKERSLSRLLDYIDANQSRACQKIIRTLYASVANTVIIPLQDILGLDAHARLNTPGQEYGNWQWRLGDLRYEWQSDSLCHLARITDR
jgi:4-alpha-glucanotransferase